MSGPTLASDRFKNLTVAADDGGLGEFRLDSGSTAQHKTLTQLGVR